METRREKMNTSPTAVGVEIRGPVTEAQREILTNEAIELLAKLARQFEGRRQELLERRVERQKEISAGRLPDFLPETKAIRDQEWRVAPIPDDLQDRRVEITGPVERKMIINALNSGANVFMADFEDSSTPSWENNLQGQINLRDAVARSISFSSPEGKNYQLAEKTATLFVRPRGWHLVEKHLLVDGKPISGSLFDFGLFFFHNAKRLVARGAGPYFYLPKMESHLEARLWNDVFNFAQDGLGLPRGTIRATVLIETILAAFEMDEILYELRDPSAGLNCGRWDYIFSFVKKFRDRPDFVLPDRAQVTMDRDFLNAYVMLLIKTCHRRGIHAMGGMAAKITIKRDTVANEKAIEKVRLDKLREVKAGHDGTWVAHPGLVGLARDVFDTYMKDANQIHVIPNMTITRDDLLSVTKGEITEEGIRLNVDVGIQYLESWLRGNGCVPIYNLMEDAATAEICRTQVWQWVRHEARMNDGRAVTSQMVREIINEELEKIRTLLGSSRFDSGKFDLAARLVEQITTGPEFPEFMTLVAYEYID